jgi:cytochrome c-type biogenesis protein
MFAIDIQTLRATLQEASLAGLGVGFLTGLVFSFNPVSFASIPVVLAYVTKSQTQRRAVLLGGAFVVGMLLTHVVLGAAAALGGEWAKSSIGHEWELLLGPVLVILGLIWLGWLKIRLPWISIRGKKVAGVWGAFLLGIPFSVAVCPFCTPALAATLTASAAIGSVPFGMALLFSFALGRSIPILLGAWSIGWIEHMQGLHRWQKTFEVVAGVTLIFIGLYLLSDYVINGH